MQARRQPASHRLLARRNGETRGCKIRAISQWEKPSMRLRSYFLRRAALGGQAFSASFRAERNEIGRASCRERVKITEAAGAVTEKTGVIVIGHVRESDR